MQFDDDTIYVVIENDEEQYSIWPVNRELPLGWSDALDWSGAGFSGSKAACLAYIEEIWTDMRPLSMRT